MHPGSSMNREALDAWLQRELGRAYNATLNEPVPEELLRLLESGSRSE